MQALRIIFMGTPEFAVPSLESVVEAGYDVVAVITAPDRPKGRGQKVIPSPVKVSAEKYNIPVLQPTNLKDTAFIDELRQYQANLQIVVAFRMLPEMVWDMPAIGTFNLHASLLPNYRGAAPINWAIMNGEKKTGITTFFLKHAIDTGNILFQEEEVIHDDDTAGSLYERLMNKGARLVLKTVRAIENKTYTTSEQDENLFTHHAPKIFKETCEIKWDQPAENVINHIRGLSPYPAAWSKLNQKVVKIYHATIELGKSIKPGQWQSEDDKVYVGTGSSAVEIHKLQLEGKKRMKAGDFLRGYQL